MEELIVKLNEIKDYNYMIRLKNKNIENEKKIEKYVRNFKKEIMKKEIENRESKKVINELVKKNKELELEINNYKKILNKIPSWLINFFIKVRR